MIITSVPKSSITVDTAFRKIITLQGCTTLPTRTNRLLMPLDTLPWCADRGCGWTRPLPCFHQDHESRNKYGSVIMRQIPKTVLKDVRRGWFTRGSFDPKQPRPS